MTILELFNTIYREVEIRRSLQFQKNCLIEDRCGPQAIRYDKDKVSGGRQTDLSEKLEQLERQGDKLSQLIKEQSDRIQEHINEACELLKLVPDSNGKMGLQEHYLFHTPWKEVADHIGKDIKWTKKLARDCMAEIEKEAKEKGIYTPKLPETPRNSTKNYKTTRNTTKQAQ